MRFLFLSYAFPGPLAPIASWLGAQPCFQVIFAACRARRDVSLSGAQRVILRPYQLKGSEGEGVLGMWDEALKAARSARKTLEIVKKSGFAPDMIFNASSNGSAMGAGDVFPDAFRVNFVEDEKFIKPGQADMRREVQNLQILNNNLNFVFSPHARLAYPRELRPRLKIAPRLTDYAYFSAPTGIGRQKTLTIFCCGDEERTAAIATAILASAPDYRVVVAPGNSFVNRKLQALIQGESRLEIRQINRQEALRELLAASALALFPENNGPILEALSAGAPVLLSRKSQYSIKGCQIVGDDAADAWAAAAAKILKNPAELIKKGLEGQAATREKYAAEAVMPAFFPQILNAWEEFERGKKNEGRGLDK